jgi:TonB family protein
MAEHPSTLRRRISAMYPNRLGSSRARLAAAFGTALVLVAITVLVPVPRLRAQSPQPATPTPAAMASAPAEQVYDVGNGVSSPVPIRQQDPTYTRAAMQAKVEGEVVLSGIVETNGLLDHVRVTKSLDTVYGLDQAAIDAATKWMFKPAMKDGRPVPVHVQLVLEFRLTASPRGTQASEEDFGKGAYDETTVGLVLPSPTQQIDPKYTKEAMDQKIQGTVTIQIVVGPNGTVDRARVVQSLDQVYGLDASALSAAREWTFNPGTLNGQPVPVLATLTMEFRLH